MFSFYNLIFIFLSGGILVGLKFNVFHKPRDFWFFALNIVFPFVLIWWKVDLAVRGILLFHLMASCLCFFRFREREHFRILLNTISLALLFVFPLEYLSQETYLALTLVAGNFIAQTFSYLSVHSYYMVPVLMLWSVFEIGL